MTQEPLFNRQSHRPHEMAETSREAHRIVRASKNARERFVLDGLARYAKQYGTEPTGGELMAFLGVSDPNIVRPRLSEMKKPERNLVERAGRREYGAGKPRQWTWRLTPRGEHYLRLMAREK
jgi:hypothetical protein